jgi:hypothetical protein
MADVSTGRQLSAVKQALLAQRLRGREAVATIRARADGVAPPLRVLSAGSACAAQE